MEQNSLKFIFIVNPRSGSQKLHNWEKLIANQLQGQPFEILYSKYPGHSSSILGQYKSTTNEMLCVVAVGGDGTVNDLIPIILRSHSYLGIIPMGSGNGLARHLKIPLKTNLAIQKLRSGKIQQMDLIMINDKYCCNTCGIGFGALVTKYFGESRRRGFQTYFKLAMRLFKSSKTFNLTFNNQRYENIWLIECANSSQLGNNAIVSPDASVHDGIADILFLQKPKNWQMPFMIPMVLRGKILNSPLSTLVKVKEAKIIFDTEQDYHIDGEYLGTVKQIDLQVLPSAIQVIY